jgi:predicted membrane protein
MKMRKRENKKTRKQKEKEKEKRQHKFHSTFIDDIEASYQRFSFENFHFF